MLSWSIAAQDHPVSFSKRVPLQSFDRPSFAGSKPEQGSSQVPKRMGTAASIVLSARSAHSTDENIILTASASEGSTENDLEEQEGKFSFLPLLLFRLAVLTMAGPVMIRFGSRSSDCLP